MPPIIDMLTGSAAPSALWALIALLLAGMAAITKGGDLFTDSSVDIARMTRIPPVIVGATIVSTATSFPEFMVSLTGTLAGATEFAVGNAIGSCLCNIGLIIGVCGIVRGYIARKQGNAKVQPSGIAASREMLQGPGMYMLASCLGVFAFSLFSSGGAVLNGQPSQFGLARWQAGLLFAGMFVYLGYSARVARLAMHAAALSDDAADEPKATATGFMKAGIVFCLATAMVVIGSRLLVTNGEAIALRMGVPRLVLGLTLFAIGTSLPEFTISLIAVLKGHEALGIGNIVGSNVLNITWVLASCALVKPLPIAMQTVAVDLPVTLLLTVLLLALPWKSERISTQTGWIMLLIYLAHLIGITVAGVL
ncbi:MAG: calcium/sodium antiporter [Planctomycetaceae bacterium]|nr:calcium/sodium antiporter [Planctomycetaceae bacterium]